MSVFAPAFFVEDDSARLSVKPQPFFDGIDRLEILLPRQRLMGIDGQGKEWLLRARTSGDQLDLGERAMQIIGDRAAHFAEFGALIVVTVQEMGGEIGAVCAGAAFEDHLKGDHQEMKKRWWLAVRWAYWMRRCERVTIYQRMIFL